MDSPHVSARDRALKQRPGLGGPSAKELRRIDRPSSNRPSAPHPQETAIRALDLLLTLAMLVVLAAPMALVALAIRLTSRGPALYFQERVGFRGRRFALIKFRTMHIDAEALTGPVWATPGDGRCTRLGKVLRRYSVDELPQLWNVLRGDMSLVGPRPERPYFVKQFAQELPGYTERHEAPPGITGWAQVNGWRGDTSLSSRLEHDLYYVRRRSLWLNVQILLLTPWRVLVERNAY